MNNDTAKKRYSGHVLVAEDVEVNRFIIGEMFEKFGLSVTFAHDGRQAVDMVCANDYALIFMDLKMPVLDGLGATREIQAAKADQCPPIIALTAGEEDEQAAGCFAAGMKGFLTKPVKRAELKAVLEKWLQS